ncbi:MAG: hypothetical protein R2705_00625 [Ilumatobacteraceae bacterium]
MFSIYGGNLPTTPWATDACGRGPAWANSLFEDNAEFGLGMKIADRQHAAAVHLLGELAPLLDPALVAAVQAIDPTILWTTRPSRPSDGPSSNSMLLDVLAQGDEERGPDHDLPLRPLTGSLVRKNVWIIGGDGWAYDIGSGGLDHVLGSGLDVNILVLDTEVPNTGGQASKSTSRAAVAKFAASEDRKKDLAPRPVATGTSTSLRWRWERTISRR